jgi:hypothetical protein
MLTQEAAGVESSGPTKRIEWKGPFAEFDRYGEYTGASYVRGSNCRIEVIVGNTNPVTHHDGCQQA